MSAAALENKSNKSLEEMDATHLQYAYSVLKEIANQQKYANIKVGKEIIDSKIAKGVQELDNGDGTDLRLFLNGLHAK